MMRGAGRMWARLSPVVHTQRHQQQRGAKQLPPFASLEGKVAVVCGAGNAANEEWGIGMCTAILYARRGAEVVAVSRCPKARTAENTARVIEEEGNVGSAIFGDMSTEEGVSALLDQVLKKHGRVDILVNAGVHNAMPNGLDKFTTDMWMNSIQVNLHTQYHLCKQFVPAMVNTGGGVILHYTTIAGTVGLGIGKQRHGYVAGKSGAAELTKRIGVEYAKSGIRSAVLSIGYCAAPLVTRAVINASAKKAAPMDEQLGKALLQKNIQGVQEVRDSYVPRGRQGQPMEVANVAAFLASDEASFINASEIFVDGGGSGCTYGP